MLMTIFFVLEIILIITYPFSDPEKRLNRYYIPITLVLSVFMSVPLVFTWVIGEYWFTAATYTLYATILVYWVLVLWSIFITITKLCRPGISQETRNLVVKRHLISCAGFVLVNVYPQASAVALLKFNNAY